MKIVIKKWLVMMEIFIYLNQTKIMFVLGKKYRYEWVKIIISDFTFLIIINY